LSSVCRARVKVNAKKRGKADCNSFRPEERATARRLGFVVNQPGERIHKSEK